MYLRMHNYELFIGGFVLCIDNILKWLIKCNFFFFNFRLFLNFLRKQDKKFEYSN